MVSVMKKNNSYTTKKTATPLNDQEMLQLKGGYRAVRGTIATTVSSRWDEIGIRLQDNPDTIINNQPGQNLSIGQGFKVRG